MGAAQQSGDSTDITGQVLVGVDGSDESLRALDFGITEARKLDC